VETLVQLLKLAEIEVLDSLHACERMVDHWDWWELAGLDAREALLAVIPDWSGEAETAALVEELARTISPEAESQPAEQLFRALAVAWSKPVEALQAVRAIFLANAGVDIDGGL